MSDFTGTEGPWQVGYEASDGDIRVIDPDGAMVATVEAKTGDGYLWSPSTVSANANLIASAPELLWALQEKVKDLVAYQMNARHAAKINNRWEGCAEAVQPSIDVARAAIKKALGQ